MTAPTLTPFPSFGSDLAPRRNALFAKVVRAPFARAVLAVCDARAARGLPGVEAVITAADLPSTAVLPGEWAGLPILAEGEIQHLGQAVALIAAHTPEAAEQAAKAMRVLYQPLPPVFGLEEAVALHAFHGVPATLERGDVGAALTAAFQRINHTFEMGGQAPEDPECGFAHAEPDGRGGLLVHTPCARPMALHAALSSVLARPMSALRVTAPPAVACPVDDPLPSVHAALIAHVTGRPASLLLSADEQRLLAPQRPAIRAVCEAGCDEKGRLLALDLAFFIDAGCAAVGADALIAGVLHHLDGVYAVPAARLSVRLCRTQSPPRAATTGALAARAQLAVEEVLARIARSLRLLPEIVRQRNFPVPAGEASQAIGKIPVAADALLAQWKHVLKQADFSARRKALDVWNAGNPLVKRGLAAVPTKLALGEARPGPIRSAAFLQVHPDGSVTVFSDADAPRLRAEVIAAVAGETGARAEGVRVVPGPHGKGRPELAVAAARDAARRLREELLPLIMTIFRANGATGVLPENLTFSFGRIADGLDPNLGFPFESLVQFAVAQGAGLSASGAAGVPHLGLPFHAYLFGAAVVEVEVDSFTGESRLVSADLFHEGTPEGDAAGPGVSELRAAFMEGVGWLTSEVLPVSRDTLSSPAGPAAAVMVPGLDEEPLVFRSEILAAGDRGGLAGPGGHALALSVREALRDAIAAFGGAADREAFDLPVPATPEAVYRLVQRQRAAKASS